MVAKNAVFMQSRCRRSLLVESERKPAAAREESLAVPQKLGAGENPGLDGGGDDLAAIVIGISGKWR